jgi:hypothetical protein
MGSMLEQNRNYRMITKIEIAGWSISCQLAFGLYDGFVSLSITDVLLLFYQLLLVLSGLSRFCVFDSDTLLCYV